jgi:hypothetical protein
LFELIGKPQFDERLSSYPQPPCLTVEGLHHPGREVYIDPLRVGAYTPSLAQIQLINDLFAGIKFPIKRLRFHKAPPLHPVIA